MSPVMWGFFKPSLKENMETNNIPRVLPEQIQTLIDRTEFRFQLVPGTTTTLCIALLDGKFNIAIGKSACVDPRLFDQKKGEDLAHKEAYAMAVNKLWELEGYRLYQSLLTSDPDQIARVAHQVNKAYCEALGDFSQPDWEAAPAWQRDSARKGVELHLSGNHGPEASHASWMAQKLAEGWQYGPEKNPETKEHPCLVSFDRLSREQQAKDFIFRGVVHAFKKGGA